jgi:hypothetical protein
VPCEAIYIVESIKPLTLYLLSRSHMCATGPHALIPYPIQTAVVLCACASVKHIVYIKLNCFSYLTNYNNKGIPLSLYAPQCVRRELDNCEYVATYCYYILFAKDIAVSYSSSLLPH